MFETVPTAFLLQFAIGFGPYCLFAGSGLMGPGPGRLGFGLGGTRVVGGGGQGPGRTLLVSARFAQAWGGVGGMVKTLIRTQRF